MNRKFFLIVGAFSVLLISAPSLYARSNYTPYPTISTNQGSWSEFYSRKTNRTPAAIIFTVIYDKQGNLSEIKYGDAGYGSDEGQSKSIEVKLSENYLDKIKYMVKKGYREKIKKGKKTTLRIYFFYDPKRPNHVFWADPYAVISDNFITYEKVIKSKYPEGYWIKLPKPLYFPDPFGDDK